ncbi:YdcH family protein [Undibacterium sp. TJN19]|uniref:YdcH family protein n=1 Tax=Undibacterium sp. TJN19 TaxID=3413055 RepID=UPI003BF08B75
MQVETHPLANDFPEFKELIHTLKLDNAHFSKLLAEYEVTDKNITRAENDLDHLGDAVLEGLKKVRISLKDQLFQILQGHAEKP